MGKTKIVAYDPGRSLQIAHCSNVVVLIGIYFKPGPGNNWPWATALEFEVPFSDRTTISEVQAYLDARNIPRKPGFVFTDPDQTNLNVGRNVQAVFQDGYLESLQTSGTPHL